MNKKLITLIITVVMTLGVLMPGGMKAEAKIPADINEYFKSRGPYYELLTDSEKEEYDFIGDVLSGGENHRDTMLPRTENPYSYRMNSSIAYKRDHVALDKYISAGQCIVGYGYDVKCGETSGNYLVDSDIRRFAEEATPVLQKAVQIVSAAKGADHEKVKYFHDYLVNNVIYDKDTKNCINPRGALIEGRAKCVGMSEAFMLLCNLADIPCYCITGTSHGGQHEWNVVKLEDGEWYDVDCTQDQGMDMYKHFLKTTAEMRSDALKHYRYTREYYIPVSNGTRFAYHGDIDDDNPYAPNGPEIKKITTKDRTMTLKWKRAQSGMNGYEIQYSTDETFKKKAKKIEIKKLKKTSRVIKKLKRGKRYYVRIRSFNRKGMYYKYSKWSKVKSIKIK